VLGSLAERERPSGVAHVCVIVDLPLGIVRTWRQRPYFLFLPFTVLEPSWPHQGAARGRHQPPTQKPQTPTYTFDAAPTFAPLRCNMRPRESIKFFPRMLISPALGLNGCTSTSVPTCCDMVGAVCATGINWKCCDQRGPVVDRHLGWSALPRHGGLITPRLLRASSQSPTHTRWWHQSVHCRAI